MSDGPERRKSAGLTDEQIDIIAERAAQRAIELVYAEIGKNVVRKVLLLVGAATLVVAAWLAGTGHLR